LPANYQYELSSWIYHTIAKGDEKYAEWLHANGFALGKKQFRLFTFSNLIFNKYRMEGDRIRLLDPGAGIIISFLPEKSTEEFVKGIFTSQSFSLGDGTSRVSCSIRSVEMMASPEFSDNMCFRTLSPMVISRKLPDGRTTYVSPETDGACEAIYNNLCSKYKAFYGKEYATGDDGWKGEPGFRILSQVKRKKITIKVGTPQQTYIIGYLCSFEMTLPPDLMKILYEVGVGEKNSMGFGMVEKNNCC